MMQQEQKRQALLIKLEETEDRKKLIILEKQFEIQQKKEMEEQK